MRLALRTVANLTGQYLWRTQTAEAEEEVVAAESRLATLSIRFRTRAVKAFTTTRAGSPRHGGRSVTKCFRSTKFLILDLLTCFGVLSRQAVYYTDANEPKERADAWNDGLMCAQRQQSGVDRRRTSNHGRSRHETFREEDAAAVSG